MNPAVLFSLILAQQISFGSIFYTLLLSALMHIEERFLILHSTKHVLI